MKEKILIVEDQSIEALNLQRMLTKAEYEVCGVANSAEKALQIAEEQHPNLVMLDIFLKGPLTGIDLAYKLRAKNIAFIYLSANSNKATLDAAKATCPDGFLVKPVREKDIMVMVEIARYKHLNDRDSMLAGMHSNGEPMSLAANDKDVFNEHFNGIIGKSKQLSQVLNHVQIVAPTEIGVLILGESGTGKEKIAQCVHDLSPRKSGPFVKVNCAALPANLIESILFGHEKGAFTGAIERRVGKFEQAQNGTIFLDEIGEIPLEIQVKLLRVLQEGEIERLGGRELIKLNVRIIAATNRDLEKEIAEGRFRMDLYYRLNVFPLYLPALRERKQDIPALVNHFIGQFCRKLGKPSLQISQQALDELLNYNWPGNIRELEHVIERSVLLATENILKEVHLMPLKNNSTSLVKSEDATIKTIDQNERDHILKILRLVNGRITGSGGAAELLGIPPSTLHSKIKRLGIRKEHFG